MPISDMTVEWNGEPNMEEQIDDIRKGEQGEVYLANQDGFEFTLSPDVVRAIKQL